MRTAIFFGAMMIADAINKNWVSHNSGVAYFTSFLGLAFILMDVVEFIDKQLTHK